MKNINFRIEKIKDFVKNNLQILNESSKSNKITLELSKMIELFHRDCKKLCDFDKMDYITILHGSLMSLGYNGIELFYLTRSMSALQIKKWVNVGYSLDEATQYEAMIKQRNLSIKHNRAINIEDLSYPLVPSMGETKEAYNQRLKTHWQAYNSKLNYNYFKH